MRTTTRTIICITLAIVIASCALLPRRKLEVFTFSEDLLIDRWVIGSIPVGYDSAYDSPESQISEILQSLAEKYGMKILSHENSTDLKGEHGKIDVWIREKEFVKDLDTVNSITIILALNSAASGKEIMKAIYTEESHETIKSYYHLYSILEKLIKAVSKAMEK
jgi:hypothetical protein